MSAFRRMLVVLLLSGVLGLDHTGTFASFTADTANGASFQTGALVLSNQRNTATACLSTAGGSTDVNANDCDALFTLAAQDGGTSNVQITVTNEGDLGASSLKLYWTGGNTPCVTVSDPAALYSGDGDLCGTMRLQVQEYPTDATQNGNDRGLDPVSGLPSHCWFGGNAGTDTCANNNNQDLAAFSLLNGTPPDVIDMGPIAAGQTRWYRVYLNVPAGQLTNAMMGRLVEWGFTWSIEQ